MPLWLTIILALGGTALIGLVVADIYGAIKTRNKKFIARSKAAREAEERELIADVVKDVMSPSCQNLGEIKEKLNDISIEVVEIKSSTVSGLRSDLKIFRDTYKTQGYATASDKAAWNQLYNDYVHLGGNHFKEYVDQWKEEVNGLPLTPPKENKKRKEGE